MSGTLINTGGGGWMNLAPGVSIPGVTPAPPPTTYDMWGRQVGGSPAPAASGAGLGNLYNTVSNTMAQQQMPANAPNLMGIGASGYDQWGRQAPAAGAPQPPSLYDQTAWLGPAQSMWLEAQGAPITDVLRAGLNVPGLSAQGRANIQQAIQQAGGQPSAWGGGGRGLLGSATDYERGEAGGGMAGVESSASEVSSDPNAGAAEQAAGADTSNEEDR